MIHDARATLTPSLSRNIWLAVLIMANIDAADTQKNDTPTAQHVCYGVHGGAIKHPKGAAAFELQEESKDRKYRFVVKRLMANQRQGDEPDPACKFYVVTPTTSRRCKLRLMSSALSVDALTTAMAEAMTKAMVVVVVAAATKVGWWPWLWPSMVDGGSGWAAVGALCTLVVCCRPVEDAVEKLRCNGK